MSKMTENCFEVFFNTLSMRRSANKYVMTSLHLPIHTHDDRFAQGKEVKGLTPQRRIVCTTVSIDILIRRKSFETN